MRKIISTLLQSRESFDLLSPYISSPDLDETSANIYAEIRKYYEKDPKAVNVDKEILLSRLLKRNDLHVIVYEDYFNRLPEPSSAVNLIDTFVDAKKSKIITDILVAIHDHRDDVIKNT